MLCSSKINDLFLPSRTNLKLLSNVPPSSKKIDKINFGLFVQASGYGGTTKVGHDTEKITSMNPKKDRLIKVMFNADTAATMRWNFRPQQVLLSSFY